MGITGQPVFPTGIVRTCPTQSAIARHSAPQPDTAAARHTITVRQVEILFADAGVQRSHRHVLRLCQSGMLDAVKIPGGPSGAEWYVAPASVPKAIGDLKQIDTQRVARHAAARPAVAGHAGVGITNEIGHDTARYSPPQQAAPDKENIAGRGETSSGIPGQDNTSSAMSEHVVQLTKRLDDKDDMIGMLKGQLISKDQQIVELSKSNANLSERFADTQKLLGAMQRMFAPLLGQGDPYSTMKNREADGFKNPQSVGGDN